MSDSILRRQIVDAAVGLAEARGWESVRLHEVAARLTISLEDIRAELSEKDQLVDAWFDRADSAMLADLSDESTNRLNRPERMHRAIMTWLAALSEHRDVTRQMILGKLEPGHIHIQIPGLIRISRTVQWMREAAGYDASLPRRAFEEMVHTGIYLATFSHWMFDDSSRSERTGRFLQRQLARAEFLFGCPRGKTARPGATEEQPNTTSNDEVAGPARPPG